MQDFKNESVWLMLGDCLERIRETAMRWTLVARIPECGEFSGFGRDAAMDTARAALAAYRKGGDV